MVGLARSKWGQATSARLTVIIGLVALAVGVRFVHLGADTPHGLSENIGAYVDEGYKTLSAKNFRVFGKEHWHAEDDYPGWFAGSPLTQGAFYVGFLLGGLSLEVARTTSVAWFALFMVTFAFCGRKTMGDSLVVLGIALLGLQHLMFFYTRLALFEVVLVFLIFGMLLGIRPILAVRPALAVGLFVGAGAVAALGVKVSAAYVVVPALAGIGGSLALLSEKGGRRTIGWIGGVACSAGLAMVTAAKLGFEPPFSDAMKKFDLFPPTQIWEKFIFSPVFKADPFLVVSCYIALLYLFLHKPGFLLTSPYRCALASIVVLGTALLGCVGVNPVRYYVPILPAFVLLILEAFSGFKEPISERTGPVADPVSRTSWKTGSFGVLFVLLYLCLYAPIRGLWTVLSPSGPPQGLLPGILPFAVILTCWLWRRRTLLLSEGVLVQSLAVALAGMAVLNGYNIARFLGSPEWEVRSFSNELERELPSDAIIAGDWAPLFTVGIRCPTLYMNPKINKPERLKKLRPSYFLYSENTEGKTVREALVKEPSVRLGEPLLRGSYKGREVALYRISYGQDHTLLSRGSYSPLPYFE